MKALLAFLATHHDLIETITQIISAGFGVVGFVALILGLRQLREAQGARNFAETMDLSTRLGEAFMACRDAVLREDPVELDRTLGKLFFLYEMSIGALNRSHISTYAGAMITRNLMGALAYFCDRPIAADGLRKVFRGDQCDDVRIHVLRHPARFSLYGEGCMRSILFAEFPELGEGGTLRRFWARRVALFKLAGRQ